MATLRHHLRHHFRLLQFLTLLLISAGDDSAVMLKLLSSLSPAPSGWSSATPCCSWTNVHCDSAAVVSINLNSAAVGGALPPELNHLSKLQSLALQKNSLSGTLPSFQNMTSLRTIYLDNNKFNSIPKNFLLGLTNLEIFSISENKNLSSWQIPNYLTVSTNLVAFHAANSGLTGIIPNIFRSFPNLQILRLSYNNLTGLLPESFSGSEIQTLWLNNQNLGLSGGIDVLSCMPQLSQVWLHSNLFSGGIPDLSNCTNLFDLQLRDNRLTGVLPPSLMNLPKLVNVTLQNNRLQGPIPVFPKTVKVEIGETNSFCLDEPGPCDYQVSALLDVARALGYPMMMADSWKGNDACKGWKFISCDSQQLNVTAVNMPRQGLSGSISPAFGNLSSLRNLELNDNNLSGVIPTVLTTLPELQVIDVSNNNLSAPLPVFRNSVSFLYSGNHLLDKNGGLSGDASRPSKRSHLIGVIVGVVVAVVCFIGVVLVVSYKCYCKIKHTPIHSQSEIPMFEGGNATFTIQILRKATNDFSKDNELGRGGFGIVYKGILQDGTEIAVKRMKGAEMMTKGMSEFQTEIKVLSEVRHRHLVALLGYCINGNERLLVYEYMPQGTLGEHLFKWQNLGYRPLNWKQRVSIALDVARGLDYLHSLAPHCFIHRDLKTSNILLSDDMRAKVADFGLVKHAPDGVFSMETRLAGTFGYLAPEYAATGRVTKRVDVYAFGVVLMEIITGRKALDETLPAEESHLVTWFCGKTLEKYVDSMLNLDDKTYESISMVAKLAGQCTARDPNQRPDMGHIVNVLCPFVEQWQPSKPEEDEQHGDGIDLRMSLSQTVRRWQTEEGTSRMFDDSSWTQSSIPSRSNGFGHSFGSTDYR